MPTFNLLTEPWIPVIRDDGVLEEVNLRDMLRRAPELREIRDPLPTVEFGLYRLLTALVLDIFRLEDTRSLGELLEAGAFDAAVLERYFAQWGERFDLFHPQYPFLQYAGMEEKEDKPLAGLLPPIPSGTGVNHFYHQAEEDFAVSPAAAARLLTLVAPFMTAGGAGLSPSINGAPPWYVLIRGNTLFETLCLNCCTLPLQQAVEDAPPAWRDDRPPREGRATEASLLEALTWRPRRIRLLSGPAGQCALTGHETPVLVRTMKFTAGASCDFAWQDPAIPYRYGNKGPLPLRPQEGREIWRDTGPLAMLRHGDFESKEGKVRFERPTLVSQFEQLLDGDILPSRARLQLAVYGMRTDMKMKVFEWQAARLALPAALVQRKRLAEEAQRGMERADSVAYHLGQAIKRLAPREGKGNKQALETLIAESRRVYWADLHGAYEQLLSELNAVPHDEATIDTELAACRTHWDAAVQRIAHNVLKDAINDLDTNGAMLKRQVQARSNFNKNIWALFHPKDADTTSQEGGSHD